MTLVTICLRWRVCVAAAALVAALPLLMGAPWAQEPPVAAAAPDEKVVERVALAFEEGDCEALLDLAASRVEIGLLGQSARYSRGQAVLVLRDFFRRYPPGDIELSERSTVGDGRAAMGRYWSAHSSGPFALYVGFRVGEEDAWRLEAIRIERGSFRGTGLH